MVTHTRMVIHMRPITHTSRVIHTSMVTRMITPTITTHCCGGEVMSTRAEARLSSLSFLRALHLASPALPIGAYAYSRGLEHAVSVGWVHDEATAYDWISGVLERSLALLDAPILARVHTALSARDPTTAEHWDAYLRASRESREVSLEDRQLGMSLAKLLTELGVAETRRFRDHGSYVTLFALACVHWGVPCREALMAFLFAASENQVTAANKLIPLGQTAGQRVLSRLIDRIEPLADRALALGDDELGSLTPGLSLASALHETQYSRLYRS